MHNFSLVNKHLEEKKNPMCQAEIQCGWLKDLFVEYCEMFRPVYTHFDQHIDECVYGHGLGDFAEATYGEMWLMHSTHKYHTAKLLTPKVLNTSILYTFVTFLHSNKQILKIINTVNLFVLLSNQNLFLKSNDTIFYIT